MVAAWPAAIASGRHPVAFSPAVGARPVAARLMGLWLVVARDAEGPFVLDDRCPHRGAPLSRGRLKGGAVICPYHGRRFGRGGACLEVPGSPPTPKNLSTPLRAVPLPRISWGGIKDDRS